MSNARNLSKFKPSSSGLVETADIADDAVSTDQIANDAVISTSGAITTTGAFTSDGIDENADATTMTIDTSENIGIGNTSPSSQYMTRLVVGDGSGTEGITIYSGNDATGRLEFSDATSGDGRYAGGIVYEHTNNALRFNTNGGNERLRIDSGGDVKVYAGDIFFASSGKGINLCVTSNTDSNTLDDYEEGTWTLDPKGNTTAGSYSATAMTGHYTKIGRIVHVEYRITAGTISSAAGSFQIHGLPFTVGGVGYPTGSASFYNVDFNPDRRQDASASASYIYFLVSIDNGVWTSIQTSAMSSNHYVHGSLTYAVS